MKKAFLILGLVAVSAAAGGLTAWTVSGDRDGSVAYIEREVERTPALGNHFTSYQAEQYPDLTYAAENAVKAVNDSKLEKTVSDAERLLKDSDGKVADNATRDALSNAIDAANGLKDGNDPAKIDGARKTLEDAINGVNASVQAKTDADAQAAAAAAAAAQAQAQAQSTYSGVSSYSGGAYRRTEGSTSGSNTYRGTTSGGSGPAAAAPKPNLNGAYGCGNSCTGKDDGYYHH